MNSKISVFLITVFSFLLWLYIAIYQSSVNNWWSVLATKRFDVDSISVGVSLGKVFIGMGTFAFAGILIYFIIGKKSKVK